MKLLSLGHLSRIFCCRGFCLEFTGIFPTVLNFAVGAIVSGNFCPLQCRGLTQCPHLQQYIANGNYPQLSYMMTGIYKHYGGHWTLIINKKSWYCECKEKVEVSKEHFVYIKTGSGYVQSGFQFYHLIANQFTSLSILGSIPQVVTGNIK